MLLTVLALKRFFSISKWEENSGNNGATLRSGYINFYLYFNCTKGHECDFKVQTESRTQTIALYC